MVKVRLIVQVYGGSECRSFEQAEVVISADVKTAKQAGWAIIGMNVVSAAFELFDAREANLSEEDETK